MVFVDNYVTSLLNNNKCYCILTYLDFDKALTPDFLLSYLTTIVDKNRILTKTIRNYSWVTGENPFFISNHYTIIDTKEASFDSFTNEILNDPLYQICKWNCTLLRDIHVNKSRLYFKIDHSYCDGYKLIEMLTTAVYPKYKKPVFKRKWFSIMYTIYYFIVGTWMLVFMNIFVLLKHYLIKQQKEEYKIDYSKNKAFNVFCGSIDMPSIKKISKDNGVTINTFLYTLMVKTWYYYKYKKGKSEDVLTGSPININLNPKEYNTNNMFVIFVETECHEEPKILLRKVEELFNLYKRSLYVPIANKVIATGFSFVPEEVSNYLFHETYTSLDFAYTNIIGPTIEEPQIIGKVTNIQYTTATYNTEACFNIISYEDKVNVNLSYRQGVIKNKKKFLRAFKKACEEMLSI